MVNSISINGRSNTASWKLPSYAIIGSILSVAFIFQFSFSIRWESLASWQENFIYRQITGALIFFVILYQWRLFYLRSQKIKHSGSQQLQLHRWLGASTPLLLYFHSMELGYAYQMALTLSMLIASLSGLLSPQILKIKSPKYYFSWQVSHIVSAGLCLPLSIFHIYLVYSYW
jgi:hypothetical protein